MIVEILMPFTQCVEEVGEARDVHVGRGAEFLRPLIKERGILGAQRAIGTEGWEHCRWPAGVLDALVICQRLDRIVGRAHSYHVELFQDSLDRKLLAARQLVVCLLPDLLGRILI